MIIKDLYASISLSSNMGMRIIMMVITSNRDNKKRQGKAREPNFCEFVASQGHRTRLGFKQNKQKSKQFRGRDKFGSETAGS